MHLLSIPLLHGILHLLYRSALLKQTVVWVTSCFLSAVGLHHKTEVHVLFQVTI